MFKLFKKRKENKDPVADSLTRNLDFGLEKLKRRFADWLQGKTNSWSRRKWKVMIIVFCLVSGGACAYSIVQSVMSAKKEGVIKISQILVPVYHSSHVNILRPPGFFITESEYTKLHDIERYMDSLSHSETGKIIYDSILKSTPGILDTIHLIEQIYLSQKK